MKTKRNGALFDDQRKRKRRRRKKQKVMKRSQTKREN
jgi:hypothetical protein